MAATKAQLREHIGKLLNASQDSMASHPKLLVRIQKLFKEVSGL